MRATESAISRARPGKGSAEGSSSSGGRQSFRAILEKPDHMLGWTIARLPFDPRATWKEMVRLRIAGEINGFGFRSSLFAEQSGGGFFILVNRAMQQGGRVVALQAAEFALWADLEARPAELPDELAMLLDDEPGLRHWYEQLGEYTRREIGKWLLGVKSADAQARRAMQMAERLLATMEAEQELPPLIAKAFRGRPRAKAGWERMTDVQRRAELFGVFYYQTPEARARRVAKLCEAAEKRADR